MSSDNNKTGDSRRPTPHGGSMQGKDLLQDLEQYSLDEAEVQTLVEVDSLLRHNFQDIENGVAPVDEDQLSGILDKVEAAPEVAVLKRTRRSIRLILWLTVSLVSLLGAYGLIALVLKIGGF